MFLHVWIMGVKNTLVSLVSGSKNASVSNKCSGSVRMIIVHVSGRNGPLVSLVRKK